jgi:ribosome-associated heat shock protein Hsp15
MYKESEESVERVRLAVEERRLQRASSPHPERRPDKRSRRRIIRFTKG